MSESRHSFIFGGARSGKSSYAESLAPPQGDLWYIATAQALDKEMKERIATHQRSRSGRWHLVEAPLNLIETLQETAQPGRFILIDCITLWLANMLIAEKDCAAEVARLLPVVQQSPARLVIVSNEVGLSIVPDNPMSRKFRDEQGRANQKIAAICEEVIFIAAGLPLRLKPQAVQ